MSSDQKLPIRTPLTVLQTIVFGIIGFAAFAILIFLVAKSFQWYQSKYALPYEVERGQERLAKRLEIEARENEALSTYRWIDKEAQTVALPIERAMELTVAELANKPVQASAVSIPAALLGEAAPATPATEETAAPATEGEETTAPAEGETPAAEAETPAAPAAGEEATPAAPATGGETSVEGTETPVAPATEGEVAAPAATETPATTTAPAAATATPEQAAPPASDQNENTDPAQATSEAEKSES